MENLLILHGWGSYAKNWDKVKETLEREGYQVFVPDLMGFGENTPPPQPWSVDDYVNWVKKYIDNLQLRGELVEPFFLLGHSFGGAIAVKFVNYFPEKVQSLILVAPKIRRQKTLRYYLGLILAKLGTLIFSIPFLFLLRPLARKILYWLIGTRDYYKLDIERTIVMRETFKKVVGDDITSYLPKVKVPTLIIWGRKDKITPLKDAYLINREIEGSRLEIIPRGRHALHLEIPEVLANQILNFIKL